jgi:hypothetical protein
MLKKVVYTETTGLYRVKQKLCKYNVRNDNVIAQPLCLNFTKHWSKLLNQHRNS